MKTINTPKYLPSVHSLLGDKKVNELSKSHGTFLVTKCAKKVLRELRGQVLNGHITDFETILELLQKEVTQTIEPSLRPVINLTGTVLHTNLGRASLPENAIQAMIDVSRGACNLEFNLETGKRDDRQAHSETLLCELTGAEATLVVNNNAAAVFLVLNSLAKRKEVPVSRGELIEIGGGFRMPDIMTRAGCKLIEVGTTNRTHCIDFETAINSRTAMLLKVHTSNFRIEGFTKCVSGKELSKIARDQNIPLLIDLGSGNLIDLKNYQLPDEPTVRETLKSGADLVTFSGDKLLGGPQAGIIAGRRDLITKLKQNPLARAMRPDKLTLAALEAVLSLYINPLRLKTELPTLRWLSRDLIEIEKVAYSLVPTIKEWCQGFEVSVVPSYSKIGSGALPIERVKSFALTIAPLRQKRSGTALKALARAFRNLPIPVIGRVFENALWLDLRCLEDQQHFIKNIQKLKIE